MGLESADYRRGLIDNADTLIQELRRCEVVAQQPVHPEICDRAADTLMVYRDLESFVREGRHGLNDLNPQGKTILDFFNCWLDEARKRGDGSEDGLRCALFEGIVLDLIAWYERLEFDGDGYLSGDLDREDGLTGWDDLAELAQRAVRIVNTHGKSNAIKTGHGR